jgi:hypothetical protein
MITEPAEAARRVLLRPSGPAESYTSLDEAEAKLRERSESERNRFILRYGVDKARLRNYDLVCDTTRASAEEVITHIIDAYEGRLGADVLRDAPPLLLLDPARVYPTEEIHNLRGLWESDYVAQVAAAGDTALEPLSIGYTGEYFFVPPTISTQIASSGAGRDPPHAAAQPLTRARSTFCRVDPRQRLIEAMIRGHTRQSSHRRLPLTPALTALQG